MLDAEAARKEIESNFIEEMNKHSLLCEDFEALKEQYVMLQKENAKSGQALNGRTRQLDAKQRELEELQNVLAITRAQVSPVETLLAC